MTLFPGWSRSRVQKLFSEGRVWRDDAALAKKQSLRAGEALAIDVPLEVSSDLRPVDLKLTVLFEDEEILVINKVAGMVVHPGSGTGDDTLAHGLLHHCGANLAQVGSPERPGIVHRLDKDTSGVLVAAKTPRAYQGLIELFSGRKVGKEYVAIAMGSPSGEGGTIATPIGRHPVQRHRMAVVSNGRPARSEWQVLERFGTSFSLFGVRILTGRTHQIRVHLGSVGHPLAGDPTYGFKPTAGAPPFPRVMLHARHLAFAHPVSGAAMSFEADLPRDMVDVIGTLREPYQK